MSKYTISEEKDNLYVANSDDSIVDYSASFLSNKIKQSYAQNSSENYIQTVDREAVEETIQIEGVVIFYAHPLPLLLKRSENFIISNLSQGVYTKIVSSKIFNF